MLELTTTPATLFIAGFLFWLIYGAAENRVFNCNNNPGLIAGHFSIYHVFLALVVVFIAYMGAAGDWSRLAALIFWAPLGLDVVWWSIRYLDITYLGKTWTICGRTVWTFPTVNKYDEGKGAATHRRPDWDNCPVPVLRLHPFRVEMWKPPLIAGVYWWWWTFGALFVVLVAVL